MSRKIRFSEEVWNEVFGRLFEASRKIAERALFEGGCVEGARIFKKGLIKKEEDVIDVLVKEGFIESGEIADGKIVVNGSFEAVAMEKSRSPVCFFLSGLLSTLFSLLREENLKVVEKSCASVSGGSCIFEVREMEWYEKMDRVLEEL